jgi:beta-N-acetylhexosaminidase
LADIIKNSYGAEATGQIDPALITSLTFAELAEFLDTRASMQAGAPGSSTSGAMATGTITNETVAAGALGSPETLTATAAAGIVAAGNPTSLTQSTAITAAGSVQATAPDLEAAPPVDGGALVQERLARTESLIREADWILFAMLDVDIQRYPASAAVSRFLSEFGDELTEQRLVVFALNAPYFLDATEMSRLTTYFGVYGKTQPFLENAVRALFRAFSLDGAPPVAAPGTRFAELSERLAPDPAVTLPLQVVDSGENLLAANIAAGAEAARQAAVDLGVTVRFAAGPIIDRNGHIVPDGTLVEFDLRYEGEELSMALEPAATRSGIAQREVVVDRAGALRVAAAAGEATSGETLLLVINPAPTPTPDASAAQTGMEDADSSPVAALPERVNLATLVIALFTIAVTLSLFLIVQVRVLPRAALVHNMLWAAIFGLLGYLLYGAGLFPGANWLRANVSVWGTTVVVFIPMLLPLLWLQLRGEE